MKYKFWFFIHNVIAHPLLITGARWADSFHDWTADFLIHDFDKAIENGWKLGDTFRIILESHDMQITLIDYQHKYIMATYVSGRYFYEPPKDVTNYLSIIKKPVAPIKGTGKPRIRPTETFSPQPRP